MKKIYPLVFFCLSFALVNAQVNLSSGLKAYYPFTGNDHDVSGNNNNPSFDNAILTADRFGNPNSAYHFDGTDSYMQIPNSPSINFGTSMSICVWVKPTGFYTGVCYNNMLIDKEITDFQPGNYSLRFADFTAGCAASTTTNEVFGNEPDGGQSITPVQLNQWYSVVFTSDGVRAKLYVNCQLVGNTPVSVSNYTNAYDLFFGHLNSTTFPYWLNGDLDEVRLYNRAINQDEVNAYGGCPTTCVPTTSTINQTICTGQNFNGHTTTGTYVDTLINVQGCDSIRTVHLTANACAAPSCEGTIILGGLNEVTLPAPQTQYYSSNGFTWECWFNGSWFNNTDNTLHNGQALITTEDSVACEDIGLGFGWVTFPRNTVGFNVDGPGLCPNRDNNPCFYSPPGGFLTNTWYHVAGVRDYTNNTSSLYFNGTLVSTKSNSLLPLTRNIKTRLGTNATIGVDSSFTGKMDEIRIWNYPRTAAEISTNYNQCLTGNEPGLVTYYHANEATGLIVHDVSPNHNDGVLDPGVTWDKTDNAPLLNSCGSPSTSTVDTTICTGQNYFGHTSTGIYTDTYTNARGCDSVRTLNLIINNNCTAAPTCNGSLGNPVVNITFGSGNNPGAPLVAGTTSYTYSPVTGNPPTVVVDGSYSIVNQVPSSSNWFTGAPDHTGNTNGYMALFNASNSPGVFYQQNITGLCAGSTYQFSAWIANINKNNPVAIVLPNVSFELVNPITNTILGTINTGDIANTSSMLWKQYGMSFTMPAGLSSITLILINNNGGGANNPGNDLAIDDIMFSPCGPQTTASFISGAIRDTVCVNTSVSLSGQVSAGLISPAYQWQRSADNGITFTDITGATNLTYTQPALPAGNYIFQLLSAEASNINSPSCRFVSNEINLVVNNCTTPTCSLVNNIIINTGYDPVTKTELVAGQKDTHWTVTSMSSQMLNALCYNVNTTSAQAPPNSPTVPPVPLNAYTDVIFGSAGTISCFPVNTIYTLKPPATPSSGNFTYTMDIKRSFFINSSSSENVTFNFTTICDDAVDSIVIDAGLPSQIVLLNVMTKTVGTGSPVNITYTTSLSPGSHTLSIQCANWEDPISGNYYPITVNGVTSQYQWNPFEANVTGSISTVNNVLVNDSCCTKTTSTIDTTICTGQNYWGHTATGTYIDTLANARGCDSIRTVNLTVNSCAPPVPCTLTNSLIINTGYDPITNTVLPVGTVDTNWKVTYLSAPMLSVTGEVGIGNGSITIPTLTGFWATNPNSSYTSSVNNGTNGYNTTFMGDYTVTATRNFTTYVADNINFNLNITADNYVSTLSIDGGPNLVTGPPNYLLMFTNFTFTQFLNPGTHTISITYVNSTSDKAYTANDNYSGLNVYGTVSSSTGLNSMQAPGSAGNCIYTAVTCDTSLWKARTTSNSSCCGGTNCTSGWLNASQFIGNGVAHVPTNLSCNTTYYYSQLEMTDTMCITNNFTYEIRLRNPASGGGIDSYDVGLSLTGSGINTGCQLIGGNGINGPVWAQQYTSAYAGTNTVTNNPALVMNFDNWHIISLTYKNNVLHYSLDGTEFFQLPYTGNICNIQSLGVLFKGSGDIDWTRILDANGNEVWRENFDSCSVLRPFPPCPTIAPTINLSYIAPTCADDTLQLFAAANQLISYSWTGPNSFTSTDQNPKIAIPTIAANGTYTVTGSTNNCSAAITTQTITISITPPASSFSTVDTSICQGQSLRGHVTTGNFKDTIPNVAGCDSVITLNLTVIPKSFSTKDTSICFGQSFRGHATTGSYKDTIPNVAGCDSIMTLNLIIKPRSFSTIPATICQGQNYLGYTSTGTFVDTLIAANGCDSIRTINLSVTPYSRSSITATICQGQNYLGYTTIGTFVDTLIATNGCDSIRTINLIVNSPSTSTVDTSICQGETSHGHTANGTYTIILTNAAGCDSTITLHLTVNSIPVVKTNQDTSICIGTSLQINTTGATTYVWSPLTNLSFPDNTSDPVTNTTVPVRYIVTGTTNGCSASDTLNVGVNQIPVLSKSDNVTICKDSSTTIYANGGLNFQWSPNNTLTFPHNVNAPVAAPLVTTVYHVIVTDANNCVNTDSIKVTVRPDAVFTVSPSTGACASITTQLLANGGDTYLWSPAQLVSNAVIKNPTTSITVTTTYTVEIKEKTCGTSANLSTTISLLPALNLVVSKSNDLDCYTPSATLSAVGADKYVWSPSTGLSNVNVAEPIAKPFSTQQYFVTGTDKNGCVGQDSIIVFGNYADRMIYDIANAFTPNGDGKNDCFGVKYFGVISDFTLMIYNRWGQQMFYTNDPTACWDGTFQGQKVDQDTYVYYLKAVTACGTAEKKGTVVLLR